VNHCKPRELVVSSASHHSWPGSHVVPVRPWFWGSTKKPSTTSSRYSCHHAARTWPHWPPGPSNQAYLSSPHLEASPATTFLACSSYAPTPIKLQPTPTILSQESVHTTLSITHHTRKRPSTGPRTTHGPQTLGPERVLVITIKFLGTPFCMIPSLSFFFLLLDMSYLSLFSCLRHFFNSCFEHGVCFFLFS
jgi:hypothetical protein